MKTLRSPALLLGALYLCFFGYLVFSAPQLPDRVASHFDAGGQPNGWMGRSSFLGFSVVFALVFPLFLVALSFVGRFLPDSCQNIPRCDYWLASERRTQTFAYLLRHSFWFACLALGFVIGVYYSLLQANGGERAHLSPALILAVACGFLLGALIWGTNLVRHFRRVPG